MTDEELAAVDVAAGAVREEDGWRLDRLDPAELAGVETIVAALRERAGPGAPSPATALALISVDEDFVLLVRLDGERVRVLLSDVSVATEWALARSATDVLGLPVADDDDDEPAGDLGIVADLGMPAIDVGVLLDDRDLYPEEVLGEIAERLGFGEAFAEIAGLADA